MGSISGITPSSTKETSNYARLCRLLVDVGSQALRDTFDAIHPPSGLHATLSSHPVRARLESIFNGKQRILNQTQWEKLYPTNPSSVSSQHFDITLLMVLLRNISGLKPPVTGWNDSPDEADMSKEADIARLRIFRNRLAHTTSQASVDDKTFGEYWQGIRQPLVRLGGKHYGPSIDKLRDEGTDPDIELHYQELLKQWTKDEAVIEKREGNSECLYAQSIDISLLDPLVVIKSTSSTWKARVAVRTVIKSLQRLRKRKPRASTRDTASQMEAAPLKEGLAPDGLSPKDRLNRISTERFQTEEEYRVNKMVIERLEEAMNFHRSDHIAAARKNLQNVFQTVSKFDGRYFKTPSERGWRVVARGKELFLEDNVSCSVRFETLLLDSSNSGAQFYISLLNVIGAFAMVVSEFKIAVKIYSLLTDLHQQSDVTSRNRDLGAAYNNEGCMALIMGNLKEAKNHFDTSLKHLNCEKRHHPNSSLLETMLIALNCNIARLVLLSRNFPEAIEKQEGLVKQCKAKEIQELPLQVIFTVLNNQAVLCTTLGYLSKAEQELNWLMSYLYKMNREDCEFLLNFVSLHLAEVLLLQGRSKEADKACRLDTLESADGTELVEMFGGLHINVRIEALEKLVEVIFLNGKIRCALRLLETGVEVLQKSFGPDHFNVASLLHKQGQILSRVGEFVSAADKMKCSINTLNEIFGVKHPLLLKCYMSLGELSLTLKRTDDSFLCFQRAMENVEEMYQVSFAHELSKKYMEITNSPKASQVSMARKDTLMIQGLIAEFGLAIAVLLSRPVFHDENSSLRRSKETGPRATTCTAKIISMKYAGDFVQSGHAFLRQDMNKEAAAFFQQAEKYCANNSKEESPSDPCLARFYSVLAKKSLRNHKPLDENGDLTDCLEELKQATTKVIPESVSKPATEDAALEITDCHLNLKLVLIFLILVSIELKMIDTTFAAFDLFTKLPQNDDSFLLFLKSGVQIYTSRASITCNGNTAVQDVLVSSAAGFTEDDSECPTSENKLFRSLALKKNVPSDRYLVTYNSSVLLDIDDLQVLESKISQSIQECFRLKCFEAGVKDNATHVAVDLTSNITFDDHDILATGRRIDLLSLCLSEELSTGVFHRGDISEISTYMHQKTTRLTFEDDQTCHFMFSKGALSLLQHHSLRQISTLSVQSQCLSITTVHPVKARLTLWRVDKCITQKIQLVQTAARHGLVSWRICELTSSLVGRCAVDDIPSLPAIDHLAKEHRLKFLTDDADSDEPLDVSIVPYQRNKIIFDGRHERFVHISSQETEEIETLRMCLNDSVLEGLTFISDISREIYGGWRREDGDVVEVSPDNAETSPSSSFAERQLQQETILSGSQEVTFANPEFDAEAAPHSTAVEAGPWAREVELISMTKDDDSQLGRSLFEEDRRSRRSFIAELQENLKRKQTPNGVVNLEEAINKGSDIVSGVKKATGRHTLKSDELDDSSTQRTFSSFELPAFYPEDTEEEAHNLSEPWLQDKNSKAADNENALGRHIFEEDRNARSTSTARLKDLEPKMGKSSQTLNSLEDGNSPDGGITPGKQDCENQQHSGDTQKGESLPGAGASFQVEQEEYKPNSTETNVTNLIAKGSVNDPGLLNVYQLEARSLIQDQTQHQQQETPRNVHRSSACTSAYVDAKGNCQIEEVNDHGQSKRYEEEIRESQDENEPLRRKEFPQILPMTEATLDSRFQFDDVVSDGPSIGTSKRAQSNANHFMPLPNTDAVDRPSGRIGTNIRAKPVSKKETGVEAPRNGSQNTKRSQLLNKANKNTAILPHFCEFLGGDVLVDGNTTYISHNKEDVVDGPVKICQDGGNKEGVNAASSFQFDVARDVVDAPVHLPKVDTKIKNIPSDFGGARPKERSTNTIKSTSTIAYQYEGTETPGIHLDFWKRHAVNGSTLEEPFQEGYGDHYFSAKGVPCDENLRAPWELFSQPSYHSEETFLELFGKGDHANIRLSRGDGQSLIGYQKPSLPQNESWHFPPADTDEAIAMQSKYDDGQICTRRRNSTEFDFIGPKVEALFNSDNSQSEGLYTEMDSMANEYHSGARKIDNGPAQSSAAIARQQSSTEDCTSSLLGSLQHIMAKTVKLIASDKAVGKQPKEQKEKQETKRQEPKELEKLGIQEESREGNEEEPAVRPRVEDSIIQVESHQENEPAPETESQSIPTPVQESPRPVCSHYQRRCLVRFPCCGKFFPCHRCHNESEDCSDDQARAINATHIRCTICYHEQAIDEHSQTCSECKSKMSEYFCPTCKHFTSVDKNPFHCDKCGICRIHRDRSFHCDVCNVCLDKRLQGKHKCRPDSGHDECCICLEDAFSGCQILPCSHKVHKDCAIAMIQNGVRTCPICRHPLFSQPQNNSN